MCDGAPVHDAMVVAFATHPHLFPRVETKPLQVVVDATGAQGAAHGMSFVDRRPLPPGSGTNVSVVMSVERVTSPAARMAWQRVSTAFS